MVHSSFVDAWETPRGTAEEPRLLRSAESAAARPAKSVSLFDAVLRLAVSSLDAGDAAQRCGSGPDPSTRPTRWRIRTGLCARRSDLRVALLPRYGVLNRRHAGNWSNRVGSARMQAEIFEIVERALVRRWPRGGPQLIALARGLASQRTAAFVADACALVSRRGHGNAACDAWQTLTQTHGHAGTRLARRCGAALDSRRAAMHGTGLRGVRESVSPL